MIKPQNETVKIGLMGDVMIGRLVNEFLSEAPHNYLWGDILPLLHSTNLNIINLEAALTKSEQIVPKVFNFKADPEKIQFLREGSIHIANLANNHVLDFAEKGLIETLETLDKANILHVGAGINADEASLPVIVEVKNVKIGILGCTDNEPSWIAKQNHPGIRYIHIGDIDAIKPDILKLRSQVDILILSIHWGPNMRERPASHFVDFAHQLIDLGVDVLHGHSAHIFQGVEVYKRKLILYDTGDFIDDYYVDPFLRNDRSFLFIIEINEQGVQSLRLIPTLISNFQVNRSYGQEAAETIERMRLLAKELHTDLLCNNSELYFRF